VAAEHGIDPYYLMEKLAAQVPPGADGVIGLFSAVHTFEVLEACCAFLCEF
jgi:hypothetical protein